MRLTLLLSSLLLAACSSGNALTSRTKDAPLNQLTEVNAKLAFTCVHERIPVPSADTDVLFQYARWLQKNNQIRQDKTVDIEIGRLYRIAAENNHYKANVNLQNGAMRGQFKLAGGERLRFSQQLIDAHVASGYYMIAIYLQKGAAGLQQDENMSLRYFRKAADEGSAQAQAYVAEKLAPIDIAPDVARQMRRCAAEQGNGKAARALGVYLSERENYQAALDAFQLGVAAGDETSASFLDSGFRGPKPDDRFNYLGQKEDLERAERYKQISKLLGRLSYANPSVPEINEIVPLPPAKLPAWDGKLKWVEEREANVPPPKPSEALIEQLAKAMVLDPKTGKPLPGSPVYSKED
ncbi:SEL1-like repeat protein [Pseudomonas sp. DWP3-1-2]|uniref:SEL1-like repeat protein n=1 Tax=Pseudomonas sp. DWP3-1-2 TaxID=2804645 RepID=UPI003CF2F5E5